MKSHMKLGHIQVKIYPRLPNHFFLNTIHEQLVDEIIVIKDPPLLIPSCLGNPSVKIIEIEDLWKTMITENSLLIHL